MPTYVVSLAKKLINDEQKSEIAQAISRVHHAETGAPLYFVQVIFDEKEPADRYLGGSRESEHIWVRSDIRSGRTEEQRRALMLGIMKEIARVTKVQEDKVWVYLCNLPASDMVEYGHMLPLPGKEQEWFDNLPKSLQKYLKGLESSWK